MAGPVRSLELAVTAARAANPPPVAGERADLATQFRFRDRVVRTDAQSVIAHAPKPANACGTHGGTTAAQALVVRHSFMALASLSSLAGCPLFEPLPHECPEGETCSDATPSGLVFYGEGGFAGGERSYESGVLATALGGSQTLTIEARGEPIMRAFRADDDGGAAVVVSGQDDRSVDIAGVAAGNNYLRIVEPATDLLFDRVMCYSAPIEEVSLIGATTREEAPVGTPTAFVPRAVIEIGLFGTIDSGAGPMRHELVDTAMTIDLPGGGDRRRWNRVWSGELPVGAHPISITAGDLPTQTLSLRIVTDIDTILFHQTYDGEVVQAERLVCFAGLNAGSYVYGLTWEITFEGDTTRSVDFNCRYVDASAHAIGDVIPIIVTASWYDNETQVRHSLTSELQIRVVATEA